MTVSIRNSVLALGLQGGLFLDHCSELLAEVVRSVDETGKAGKLTITLDLKKAGGAVALLAKATNKVPEQKPDDKKAPLSIAASVIGICCAK